MFLSQVRLCQMLQTEDSGTYVIKKDLKTVKCLDSSHSENMFLVKSHGMLRIWQKSVSGG